MKRAAQGLLIAALAAMISLAALAQTDVPRPPDRGRKKIIEAGWDEPDPAFMRRHLEEMERSPFDGCGFHLPYTRSDGTQGNFTWEAWGRRRFRYAELKPAVADLKALHPRHFTYNLPRLNLTPADLDWFDDYSAVLANVRLIARVAREGRCPGVWIDPEEYKAPLFDYRRQRHADRKSWRTYARQVRRRGRQVMQAFQRGYPGLTLFISFGYMMPWDHSHDGAVPLADTQYGLYAPFLDGLYEAASGRTRIIEGGSIAFGYRDTTWFPIAYRKMKLGVAPIVANPRKYARKVSVGFCLWLDYDWYHLGWRPDSTERNYFSPSAFEASVRHALEVADEFVLIYGETPRWWSEEGTRVKLPDAYDAVLRRVRKGAGLD